MKDTLSNNTMLFNVKAIAAAGLKLSEVPDNTFAIVDNSTNLTVAPATYAALPAKFKFFVKNNGKVYYSITDITKNTIKNTMYSEPAAQVAEIWTAVMKDCECFEGFQLIINLEEDSLLREHGLSWTDREIIADVTKDDLGCFCDCNGHYPVYENHVATMLAAKRINEKNSPFFKAVVQDENGLEVADVEAYVEANKAVNTDSDDTNDTGYLTLVLMGKEIEATDFYEYSTDYIYPRGVRMYPAITVGDKGRGIAFTQTQELVYDRGMGCDVRAVEWDNMNNYTDLNYFARLSDGTPNSKIKYQFDNGVDYYLVTFEYSDKKSGLELVHEGDYHDIAVILGTETEAIATQLNTVFTPAV